MFGDWWIDTDVVCLSSAWPDEKKFVAAWERGDYVNGAVLRLDKYSAETLKQRALALGDEVKFAQSGARLLTNFVHEESKEDLVLPQSAFYPIPHPHWQRFYQEEFCYDIWAKARASLAIHLWHSLGAQHAFEKQIAPPPDSFFGQIIQREETGHLFAPEPKALANGATFTPTPVDNFDQPLVSVIISNYNYAKYLRTCLDSVYAQSYRKIECILVDDASTDESSILIDELKNENPRLIVHKRPANGGQSAAVLDGLARASGQFVVLLDSDDVLLPNAIASHLYVHQSLRQPIGFTCSDMLQIAGNTIISSASPPLNEYVVHQQCSRNQPRHNLSTLIRRPPDVGENVLSNIYLVTNRYRSWAWSATSAMMFRRDALRLWEKTPGLKNLRYSTDAFFCYGINSIVGSALIDAPLAAYRIHGKNGFTAGLPLNGIRNYEIGSQGENSIHALKLLVREATRNRNYRRLFFRNNDYKIMLSYLRGCLKNLRLNSRHERAATGWFRWPSSNKAVKSFWSK
jgi:glycosyltransferase involved in cell wall biosynthesis